MSADREVLLRPLDAGSRNSNDSLSGSESLVIVGGSPGHVESGSGYNESLRYLKYDASEGASDTFLGKIIRWLQGPNPPRVLTIHPIFPNFQTWPVRLLERFRFRSYLLIGTYAAWFIFSALILYRSVNSCSIGQYGQPVRFSCQSRFWKDGPSCGLNGQSCEPFTNVTFPFHCPSSCEGAKIWTPYKIGTQEIVYRNLVIGGPKGPEQDRHFIYRGDSFICGAARHAGLISDIYGGAGVVSLVGEQSDYPGVHANGISSIGFLPSFPLSFTFLPVQESIPEACKDPRWSLLIISVICTSCISLFVVSPPVFFWSCFTIIYFTVALGTDPPDYSDFNEVISSAFARFLPSAFVAAVIYKYCVRRTVTDLTAQYEKTVLWLGACYVGGLNDYTFDNLPIQRLTPHDLRSQAGAIPTLIAIITTLVTITITQAYAFRLEGRLPQYLKLYAILVITLLTFVVIPSLHLRIHHYVLALLLLPGTSLQTRPSLLYQGLLVGLFISGVARWGYASILETDALLFADGPVGGAIPALPPPFLNTSTTISFNLSTLTSPSIPTQPSTSPSALPTRLSILLNDVERYRTSQPHLSNSAITTAADPDNSIDPFSQSSEPFFNTTRRHPTEPEYIRIAYVRTSRMGKDIVGDYSEAGIWWGNGSWTAAVAAASPEEDE